MIRNRDFCQPTSLILCTQGSSFHHHQMHHSALLVVRSMERNNKMRNHANYVFHYLSLFPLDGSPHFNYSSHHILSAFSLSTPPEPAARPQGRMINTALARLTPHQLNNKHPEHVRVTTKFATCIHYVDDETRILYFVTFCHRRRQH